MLIKQIDSPIIQYNKSIQEALSLFKKSSLPFIPVVDENNRYVGVFDTNCLIQIIEENISLDTSLTHCLNKNFPTILKSNISQLLNEKNSSYIIVLDHHASITGFISPFEHNDFINLLNIPFFDHFLDCISDGVLICDRDLTVKKVNKAYTQITGVPANEIEGFKVNKIRKGAQIPHTVQNGITMKNIYRKEGNSEYFVDLYPITVNNDILGGLVLAKDITEIHTLTKKATEWKNKFSKLKSSVNAHHRANKTFDHIIYKTPRMKQIIDMAKKVSSNDSTIIIRGESGTGKDILAQAIHNYSYRRNEPFVAINCASIAPTLILSELFGYEDGAFTGASRGGKIGLFELANHGTLFLDEIGDMDFELQSKLLRVLENGEITRVGGAKNIKVDVRIIAATNINLEASVENHKFRSDLYYRLNVIPIFLPPLRERKGDIPELIKAILKELNHNLRKDLSITEEAISILSDYNWPGNIRELQNVLSFIFNVIPTNVITPQYIPEQIREYKKTTSLPPRCENVPMIVDDLKNIKYASEREQITRALAQYGCNLEGKKLAAKALGISVATLYNRIKQYGIVPNS